MCTTGLVVGPCSEMGGSSRHIFHCSQEVIQQRNASDSAPPEGPKRSAQSHRVAALQEVANQLSGVAIHILYIIGFEANHGHQVEEKEKKEREYAQQRTPEGQKRRPGTSLARPGATIIRCQCREVGFTLF